MTGVTLRSPALLAAVGGLRLPIDAGLLMHFDADQLTGLSNGDPVTTWPDSSGNGHDALTTSDVRVKGDPTYVASGRNGLPTVAYSDHELKTATFASVASPPFHIFAVAQVDASAQREVIYKWQNGSSTALLAVTPDDKWRLEVGGTLEYSGATRTWRQVEVQHDGADTKFYVDAFEQINPSTPGTTPTMDRFYVGAVYSEDQSLDGEVAELVCYSRILTDAERGAVNEYLSAKWDVA